MSLDAASKWIVTGTSYLTHLTLADGATVKAPWGHTVSMTVDGVATPLAAGDYTGTVVLTVN